MRRSGQECRACRHPSSAGTSTGANHLSKYLSLSFGYVLGKVILCCYSFAGSSSILTTDTLVEVP